MCANCCTFSVKEFTIPTSPVAGSFKKTPDNTPDYEVEYSYHHKSLEAVVEEIEGISPLKKSHTMNKAKRCSYGKRKSKQLEAAIKNKVAKALNVPEEEFASSEDKSCSNCDEFDKLISEIKEKIKTVPRREIIKILTLLPESWSRDKICKEFNVSEYNKSRKLKREMGILSDPGAKQGKILPPEVSKRIKEFYESDEFSRMCPGKKEFVSVRENNIKVHKQKRLLLIILKELYAIYKEHYPSDKMGLTKFCNLRPKWCITVASSGMHSVCM